MYLPMARTGLAFESFESSIGGFSLKFLDPQLERSYIQARLEMQFLTTATKRFLLMMLAGHISFHALDVCSALGINPDYKYTTEAWVAYSLLLVVIVGEIVCFFCHRLMSLRGLSFSLLTGAILLYINFSGEEKNVFYPFTGTKYFTQFTMALLSTFVWSVSMLYLHMHYIRNWLTSLWNYIVVFAEFMTLLYYFYGPRFVAEEIVASRVIDILYYILTFGWFTACSVFAIWTHEMTERQSFYAKYQQMREIAEWKRLLRDIPEPVIFTHHGQVNFFNQAAIELFVPTQSPSVSRNSCDERCKELDVTPESEDDFKLQCEEITKQFGSLRQKATKCTIKEILVHSAKPAAEFREEQPFVYKRDGRKRLLMLKCVRSSKTRDEGVVEYILHDVTAIKDLERGRAKDQCFDMFLATASHDIRTPLNVMLGIIEVLSDYATTMEAKEQINVARSCGQKMLYYLKGLTFIRQINLGTLATTKQLFNPAEAARAVVGSFEFSAHIKNVSLDLSIDPSVPPKICSDKEMYSIILQNLLENSFKYTFIGGVKVAVSYNTATNLLATSVTDTGIGMTEKQQNNVGSLFKKSKSQYITLNPQGLGLGLFLVKTLSQQLDGALTVHSIEKRGTAATFTISGYSHDEALSEGLTAAVSTRTIPLHLGCNCTKVLLVDDDPFNLIVLSAYLASINVKADKAENGRIALDMIQQRSESQECPCGYSVVFMDINMPVMDGIEATAQIHELVRAGTIPHCYVVAVTAAIDLDKHSVCAHYLAKGFSELCKCDACSPGG